MTTHPNPGECWVKWKDEGNRDELEIKGWIRAEEQQLLGAAMALLFQAHTNSLSLHAQVHHTVFSVKFIPALHW